jgi:hypothetical protein
MIVNLYSTIKIKLTDTGVSRLKGSYFYIVMKQFPIDENNEVIMPLLSAFDIFGRKMIETPFADNCFEIIEEV